MSLLGHHFSLGVHHRDEKQLVRVNVAGAVPEPSMYRILECCVSLGYLTADYIHPGQCIFSIPLGVIHVFRRKLSLSLNSRRVGR